MEKIIVQVDADLEELIKEYLQNRRKDVEDILQALGNQDFETIRVLGHNMKGTGGGYGFDDITAIGCGLEDAAKAKDVPAIRQEVAVLLDYLQAVEVVFR